MAFVFSAVCSTSASCFVLSLTYSWVLFDLTPGLWMTQFTLVPLVCGQLPLPQILVECKAFAGGAPLYDARDAGMCFVAPRLKDQMDRAPGALAT
jgi:hypothetical protein